ncbi:MAG TPA: hypothetical protein VKF36_16535, partial [Syntrophorhabdales bacterium]|nr:hypothetical protein [Syntrophorhabdales bacterium]
FQKIISVLSSSTREIDVKGWYTDGAIVGILFTEFGRMHNAVEAAKEAIIGRLYGSLSGILSNEDMVRMKITPYPLSREAVASNAQRVGGPGPLSYATGKLSRSSVRAVSTHERCAD